MSAEAEALQELCIKLGYLDTTINKLEATLRSVQQTIEDATHVGLSAPIKQHVKADDGAYCRDCSLSFERWNEPCALQVETLDEAFELCAAMCDQRSRGPIPLTYQDSAAWAAHDIRARIRRPK